MTNGRPKSIPITRPYFTEEEAREVARVLESGWVVQGPYVETFEELFCRYASAKHAIATTSCTTALHTAMAALGVRPDDEVIVPAFTWISTANVVEFMGGRPVFCDIDLATFNIDVGRVESLITPRTVGIIPVHLFGLCADMPALLDLAEKHQLWLVEDAACALGARIGEQHAGTFGRFGCFSFHPRKSVTTGEGGIITCASDSDADLCRCLRDHGASRSDHSRHHSRSSFLLADYDHLGFNYRMTDLQAAVGVVQMGKIQEILQARTVAARRYDEQLAGLDWLRTPSVAAGYTHGFQSYVTLFAPDSPTLGNVQGLYRRRNRLMARLEEQGIATRQGTHAPILTGYYRRKYKLREEDFPNSVLAERLSLSLPLYAQITANEQSWVAEALRRALDA